jgi:hypothetical protein
VIILKLWLGLKHSRKMKYIAQLISENKIIPIRECGHFKRSLLRLKHSGKKVKYNESSISENKIIRSNVSDHFKIIIAIKTFWKKS